jgi:hypothetical protein
VPVYLHHRFTIGAGVQAIGGMEHRYAVRGDPLPPTEIIAPARQRRALELLLDAIQPASSRPSAPPGSWRSPSGIRRRRR